MNKTARLVLVVVLILLLLGMLPTWGFYGSNWGYGPSGGVGLLVLVLVILIVMGKI